MLPASKLRKLVCVDNEVHKIMILFMMGDATFVTKCLIWCRPFGFPSTNQQIIDKIFFFISNVYGMAGHGGRFSENVNFSVWNQLFYHILMFDSSFCYHQLFLWIVCCRHIPFHGDMIFYIKICSIRYGCEDLFEIE